MKSCLLILVAAANPFLKPFQLSRVQGEVYKYREMIIPFLQLNGKLRGLLFCALLLAHGFLLAQRGPGGVSVESGSQSTCRAWLDASTLTTLADGDDLTVWPDVSLSANADNAAPAPSELPPFFRDDPANTINGYPVVTFEDGRFLLLNSTPDLNLEAITYTKSLFFAFRTSTDVTSKQVLYEEGGCWRGLNIYIDGGQIYCGAYDLNPQGVSNGGNRDPDNTPQWGYSFVSSPIQANSTYILTMQFSAPSGGVLSTNTTGSNGYYIRGWLNGQVFDVMDFNSSDLTNTNGANTGVNGIGTLFAHPDPIGLGAINSDYIDADGLNCNSTGEDSFRGRLAEICYYNDLLTESERIIIENYLGAKYFANIIVNDKYDHQANYGTEVIGIGQQTNTASNRHNLSQGRNPFLISADNYNSADQFFLTGHNGANLLYTDQGVPNESPNIQRLQRTWRVDERSAVGSFGDVTITIDKNDLPNAPSGFSKLVLLVDETNPNFPNFSLSTTVVKEIPVISGDTHEIEYDFPDNAFYTFGWLRPEVNFTLGEASEIEADSPPATSGYIVEVSLNYEPDASSGTTTVDYIFVDAGQTAEPGDYSYNPVIQSAGVTFPPTGQTAFIPLEIVNDNVPDDESTEELLIILQNGLNTSPDLNIGERDTLVFSILDDDPPPTASFEVSAGNVLENATEYWVKVRRTGDPSDMAVTNSAIWVRRRLAPDEGTAEYNVDYELQNADGWAYSSATRRNYVTFPAENVSSQTDSVRIVISDDDIDEEDETIGLFLYGALNIAIDPSSITSFDLTILDDDPEPEANFLVDNQTGYESVGDPVIFVELDRPSTRDVEVEYQVIGGTASIGNDYNVGNPGFMLFAPGDTLAFPDPFTVDNGDATGELDETVIFQLVSADNATIGPIDEHTYTIVDYAPFEWKGAAGIGRNSDNIVWIDANRMTGSGEQQSITNFSPRDIDIIRYGGDNNRAELLSNQINGRNALQFDGGTNTSDADVYEIDNSSFINLAGFVEKKSYFFVIRPNFVPTTGVGNTTNPNSNQCAVIYEQGAGTRGLSIYLYNDYLWLHAWNDNNDGPESPWGYDQQAANNNARIASTVWARSAQTISPNTNYVVSCHYDNDSNEPLMVYVNGRKGIMSSTITADPANSVGRLYGHAGRVGLGAVNNGIRYHFSTTGGSDRTAAFNGRLAEFIKFHEPQMNEARRIIIENYLSAKYNIPLFNSDTPQIFDLTYASAPDAYNEEVAGVGQSGLNEIHGDAQGPSSTALRVKNPIFNNPNNPGYVIWGHNGESLANTWPFSFWNSSNPVGINERSGKVWRISESSDNNVSTADIFINFSESDSAANINTDESLLKLLVSTDPNDWSAASVYDAHYNSGFVAQFDDVPISDGMYISLGNTSPINSITPLPIELLDFDAKLRGNYVDITWSTATELNNDYFVVERSGEDLVWEPIITTPGAGNSNTLLDYAEKDRNPLEGISYYRLKQVDFDGRFTYSDPVSVFIGSIDDNDDVFMYPNPSSGGSVFIKIPYATRDYQTNIHMYDLSGKVIQSERFGTETDLFEFDYGTVPNGIYLIQIQSDAINESKKLIID